MGPCIRSLLVQKYLKNCVEVTYFEMQKHLSTQLQFFFPARSKKEVLILCGDNFLNNFHIVFVTASRHIEIFRKCQNFLLNADNLSSNRFGFLRRIQISKLNTHSDKKDLRVSFGSLDQFCQSLKTIKNCYSCWVFDFSWYRNSCFWLTNCLICSI